MCHDAENQLRGYKMSSLTDLTPRELEILQLVVAGKTNKEIAHEVLISKKTVEFHLGHIYTKVGVRTRLMVGIWALQRGINKVETRDMPS